MIVKRVIRTPPRKEEARSCTNAGFFLKEKLSRGEAVRQPRLRAVHYYGASPRTRRIGSSFPITFFLPYQCYLIQHYLIVKHFINLLVGLCRKKPGKNKKVK